MLWKKQRRNILMIIKISPTLSSTCITAFLNYTTDLDMVIKTFSHYIDGTGNFRSERFTYKVPQKQYVIL